MATVPNLANPSIVDRKYASVNRFLSSAAIPSATPLYAGEKIVSTDTGARYEGLAVVAGAWGRIESKSASSGGGGGGGGFPDASTTGPAIGTVFTTTTGNFQSTAPGQIIEKRTINNGMITWLPTLYTQALIDYTKGNYKAARDGLQAIAKGAPSHLPSNAAATPSG